MLRNHQGSLADTKRTHPAETFVIDTADAAGDEEAESFQLIFTFSVFKVKHICVSKCTTMLDDKTVARLLTTCPFICLKIRLTSVFNDEISFVF